MDNLLSNLPRIIARKKKRLGRGLGSGKGSKSGRGTTRHQKAREKIPLFFEGGQARMIKKFPLLRGKGRNRSFKKNHIPLTLDHLNKFNDEQVVSINALVKKKIINNEKKIVKVLNKGKLEKKLIVKIPVSASVKKIIESKGGQVTLNKE